MPAIGLGLGLGLLRSGRFSTPQLNARLLNIYGAGLTDLWTGDGVVFNGSEQATGWVGGVNAQAFTLFGTTYYNKTCVNGRVGILSPAATIKGFLHATLPASKSLVVVAGMPALPSAAQHELALVDGVTGPDASLLVTAGSSTWYASGWTQYRDGVATNALATGIHVYQADKAANTTVGLRVGGWTGADTAYPGEILAVMALSVVPTAEQRVLHTANFKSYYAIP